MVSRRELLFGMVRRLRETSGDKPVSGIGADIGAADAAYARKDWAVARDLYREVLKVNRDHKEARVRQGLCHYHLGEYVQAKDTLLMVFKQYPADYLVCLYLGLAYARRDQLEKCMDVWKKFVDREHIGVMREINVHRALYETGEALIGAEVAQAVEQALSQTS
jgi:tetratricopeptide (TPR) repeat protein